MAVAFCVLAWLGLGGLGSAVFANAEGELTVAHVAWAILGPLWLLFAVTEEGDSVVLWKKKKRAELR